MDVNVSVDVDVNVSVNVRVDADVSVNLDVSERRRCCFGRRGYRRGARARPRLAPG